MRLPMTFYALAFCTAACAATTTSQHSVSNEVATLDDQRRVDGELVEDWKSWKGAGVVILACYFYLGMTFVFGLGIWKATELTVLELWKATVWRD